MATIHQMQQQNNMYRSTHPLLSNQPFVSWQELCDAAIEAGQKQAQEDLHEVMTRMTFLYSDAILAASKGDDDMINEDNNGGH